jgi:hypothetical protein
MVVKAELEKLGFNPISVELGEVILPGSLTVHDKIKISEYLNPVGFELLEDRKSQIDEQIQSSII